MSAQMLRTIIFLIFFTTAFGKTRNSHLQHYHVHDRLLSLVDKLYSEMLLADTNIPSDFKLDRALPNRGNAPCGRYLCRDEETLGDSMEDLDPETEIERRSKSRRSTGSKSRRSTGSKSRRSTGSKSRRSTGSNQSRSPPSKGKSPPSKGKSPPSKGKSEKAKDILGNLGGDLGNSLKDAAFGAAADAGMDAIKNKLGGNGEVDDDVNREEEGDDVTEEETDPEKLDDFSICDLGSECPAGFNLYADDACDCVDDNENWCRISSTSKYDEIDPCSEMQLADTNIPSDFKLDRNWDGRWGREDGEMQLADTNIPSDFKLDRNWDGRRVQGVY